MAKSTGWVPQQHGAWAMVLVPYLAGLATASRVRHLDLADLFLGLTWLVGYFAFNAATLTLKSPAKRRSRFIPPLAAYSAIAASCGIAALATKGWSLLWWVPAYAVLLGISLWLAASKRERSLASGVLTVVASCGLMGVLRLWSGAPALTATEVSLMLAVTLYFVGTVVHVKALIRERNTPAAATRSIGFHGLLALAAIVAVVLGWLGWPWIGWALALLARAWWMPRTKRTPAQIGGLEIVMSVVLVGLALIT